MSMVKIEHLRKEYPNVTPLEDVCANINKGDVISVIGPSGTGKSTLLRCLNQLEEPTSALDPTMVGEVLTVIKNLAKDGMTMMIVTHEMKFARDVSNRVFYMDEGGIYEEGTPDQIFSAPTREKTRIFIKKLKQLSEDITSLDFDFIGFIARIEQFGRDNMVSTKILHKLELAFEELVVQNIISNIKDKGEGLPINIRIEYSEVDEIAEMGITYGGGKYDPFVEGDDLSTTMIKKLASNVKSSYSEKNEIVMNFK